MSFLGFPETQAGPGGAGVLGLGSIGYSTPQTGANVPNTMSQSYAPSSRGFHIPVWVWMFVLLIVGYAGVHTAFKAV